MIRAVKAPRGLIALAAVLVLVTGCGGHPAALAIGSRAPSPAAGGARRVRQHQGNGGRRAPDLGRLQRSRGGALGAGLAARRCCILVCNAACGRGLAAGRELEQGPVGHEGSFAGPDDRGPAARSVAAGCHYRRPDCRRQPAAKPGGRADAWLLVFRCRLDQKLTTDQHDRPGRAAAWNAPHPAVALASIDPPSFRRAVEIVVVSAPFCLCASLSQVGFQKAGYGRDSPHHTHAAF